MAASFKTGRRIDAARGQDVTVARSSAGEGSRSGALADELLSNLTDARFGRGERFGWVVRVGCDEDGPDLCACRQRPPPR